MRSIKVALCAIACTTIAPAQSQSTASGTLTVNGTAWKLTYARALRTTDWTLGPNQKYVEVPVIKLMLSDSHVEDVEDDFELGVEGKNGTMHGLRLEFSLKGEPMSGSVYDKTLEGGTSEMFVTRVVFDPKSVADQKIEGTLRLSEPIDVGGAKVNATASFAAPVLRDPKPSVEGRAAAETEPGKAVLEFLRAFSSMDLPALKQVLRKEMAEMLEKPEGQQAFLATLSQAYPADEMKQMTIVRVFDYGDRAWVEGMSKRPSETKGTDTDVTYRIRVIRVAGIWKVQPI